MSNILKLIFTIGVIALGWLWYTDKLSLPSVPTDTSQEAVVDETFGGSIYDNVKADNPVEKMTETNPFTNDVNPYESAYTNPFGNE